MRLNCGVSLLEKFTHVFSWSVVYQELSDAGHMFTHGIDVHCRVAPCHAEVDGILSIL